MQIMDFLDDETGFGPKSLENKIAIYKEITDFIKSEKK